MIKDDLLKKTGYGISTTICDNGHTIIYIDDDNGTVTIGEKSWTYADYIAIDLEALETILEEIGY